MPIPLRAATDSVVLSKCRWLADGNESIAALRGTLPRVPSWHQRLLAAWFHVGP